MAGPAMAPMPTTLKCVPSALPRSSSLKAATNIPIPQPWTMPAPTPFSTRMPISMPNEGAKVAPRDAMTKIAVPMM